MSGGSVESTGRRRDLLAAAAIALGLVAVYAPVLRSRALFNDDYLNLMKAPSRDGLFGEVGRPLQYPLLIAARRLFAMDVLLLRGVLFALFVALALVVFRAVKGGLGRAGAAAVVLFAFSAPAFLITFAWLSVAVNIPAYLAAAASYATGYLLLDRARSGVARAALGLASVLLVALASLTYQIAAGLPLALVVYHLLFEAKGPGLRRRALTAYALVGGGLVLSIVALRVLLRVVGVHLADRAQSILSKMFSLSGLLLPLRIFDANFALHYYYWGWLTREAAAVLGLALTVLVARVAWREVRSTHTDHRENRARWFLAVAGLLFAGMLYALDGSRELRSKLFLTLLLLFVVAYALREAWSFDRRAVRTALLSVLVLGTMWSGRRTLAEGLVQYSELELAEVRAALSLTAPGTIRHVHLIQPENRCFSPPCYGWFEFNLKLSSSRDWVPPGLIRYALAGLGRGGEEVSTTFSHDPPEDGAALVVDLGALERRLVAERGEVLDLETYLKRRRAGLAQEVSFAGLWLVAAPAAAQDDPLRRR
jgi:hypothetical protein